ncbi:MAG: family 10 glycosylhydrolase [Calditrichae bacterium]|nr:family 10 glycosylhydrolase [Calditrichia bacterium]
MKLLIKLLFFILFLNELLFSQFDRGIWVVRDALTSKESIQKIIKNAKALKTNKIFIQFRALGKVYYPSKLDIPKADIDSIVLGEFFKQAKENNIEVHAWLNTCYIWSNKSLPTMDSHIIFKSKSSIIEPINSTLSAEGYFLHPNDTANITEVKSIIKELLDLYPISGIHLDYFRYPKEELHTSKLGRTEYQIKYSFDPLDALQNPERFIKERNYSSYMYLQNSYTDFLRDELTAALTDINHYVKSLNPALNISVAVKPNPIRAKHRFYQDWAKWLDLNLCDFIVLMNYNPELSNFVSNLEMTKLNSDTQRTIVGIATYNISENEITSRLTMIENSEYKGYALFSYNYLQQKKNLFNHIKMNVN